MCHNPTRYVYVCVILKSIFMMYCRTAMNLGMLQRRAHDDTAHTPERGQEYRRQKIIIRAAEAAAAMKEAMTSPSISATRLSQKASTKDEEREHLVKKWHMSMPSRGTHILWTAGYSKGSWRFGGTLGALSMLHYCPIATFLSHVARFSGISFPPYVHVFCAPITCWNCWR